MDDELKRILINANQETKQKIIENVFICLDCQCKVVRAPEPSGGFLH
jgi:hypothetical protein